MSLADFAETCAALAATRSKNRKVAAAAAFLADLDDDELPVAARFLAGWAFPPTEERNLQVGWSTMSKAALRILPLDRTVWSACVQATGDAAEALGKLLEVLPPRPPAQTTLADFSGQDVAPFRTCAEVARVFDALAAAPTTERKVTLLDDALRRVTPLEARYVTALTLGGDLRTGFGEPLLEEALARAFGRPLAPLRLAAMLLGDPGATALLARADRLDEARLVPLHPLQFMLASPVDAPPEDVAAYVVEDKYDGVRTQAHKDGDRARIFSRTLDAVTERFPEIADALRALPGSFVLDGEVVAWRDGRALPFQELQRRLGRKDVDAAIREAVPLAFVAYDLLYRDGRETFREPIERRRADLEHLLARAPPRIVLAPQRRAESGDEAEGLFAAARAAGNEGLMLKRLGSGYDFGKRGKAWLKYKKAYATLDVVVTAAEQGTGKRAGLLSDYTFAVRGPDGDLLNVGKAYIGVTDQDIRTLTERFRRITTQRFGHVHLVKPEVVLEVAFDQVQKSGRHKSGYALRFPRIVRIRDDKGPDDIDTLARVEELARTGAHSAPGGEGEGATT